MNCLRGRIQYPVQGYTGYGDGVGSDLTVFISDQMRADWKPSKPPRRDALRRTGLMVENCTYGQPYDQCAEST
jgi:hypothetical protein